MLSWSRLLNYQEFCELVVRHNSYQKVKVCTHIMKYIKKKVNTQRSLFPSFYWTFIYALRLFMFIVFIRRKQYVTHASLPALHSVMTQCGSLKLTTVGTFMLQKLKNATNRAWHIVLMIVQISDMIVDNILTVQVKFKHAVSVRAKLQKRNARENLYEREKNFLARTKFKSKEKSKGYRLCG